MKLLAKNKKRACSDLREKLYNYFLTIKNIICINVYFKPTNFCKGAEKIWPKKVTAVSEAKGALRCNKITISLDSEKH